MGRGMCESSRIQAIHRSQGNRPKSAALHTPTNAISNRLKSLVFVVGRILMKFESAIPNFTYSYKGHLRSYVGLLAKVCDIDCYSLIHKCQPIQQHLIQFNLRPGGLS